MALHLAGRFARWMQEQGALPRRGLAGRRTAGPAASMDRGADLEKPEKDITRNCAGLRAAGMQSAGCGADPMRRRRRMGRPQAPSRPPCAGARPRRGAVVVVAG